MDIGVILLCHTPVTQRLTKRAHLWESTHNLKHGVATRNWQFYLNKDGSGGETRTPDTRIIIPLIQTKSPFTHSTHPSNHRDPRRKNGPNLGLPLRNIESKSANSPSNPRVPRFELLDPMPYAVRMLLKPQCSRIQAPEPSFKTLAFWLWNQKSRVKLPETWLSKLGTWFR